MINSCFIAKKKGKFKLKAPKIKRSTGKPEKEQKGTMLLVDDNVESYLRTFVSDIKEKAQSWRLISIEFQDCETLRSQLFQNLCDKNLELFFQDTDCRIYWAKPSFIMIFFQGRALPIEKCVEGFLKETEFKGFGRFFDILDLSIHWDNLIALVNRIYEPAPPKPAKPPVEAAPPTKPLVHTHLPPQYFIIELSAERIAQMQPTRVGRTKPLALLVEDDLFTAKLVKISLEEDFQIIHAETARQAFAYYQRHIPDIVFLDIQLPDGNGLHILEEITAVDPGNYICMLSSHTQREKILEAQNKGAKNFIGKPFTRQRLNEATQKYFEFRRNLQKEKNHGT